MPGHGNRDRVRARRHGRTLGHEAVAAADGRRRRAPRLYRSRQSAARVGARRPGRQARQHAGQHAGGRARRARARRHRRGHRRSERRRLGEQVEIRDAASERQRRRLGAVGRADDGCRLVPAGHPVARHRRYAREGDAAREVGHDGPDRYAGVDGTRAVESCRGAAARALRQGERARHRCAGTWRADDGARREGQRLADARGEQTGRAVAELRGHASCAFRARRQRAGDARAALA